MALALAEILDERNVVLELAAPTRDEALREIISAMNVPNPDAFLREVIAREELNTTLMPNGVAFPHARTDLVQRIVLGIGRSANGVEFGPDARAQLIFVVGVPRRMVTDYLVCVGAIARLVRNSETRTALLASATAAELIELMRAGSMLLE
jgi:mannitol/fructose-specific phosphotransferase system IIA component (Ntr-type)